MLQINIRWINICPTSTARRFSWARMPDDASSSRDASDVRWHARTCYCLLWFRFLIVYNLQDCCCYCCLFSTSVTFPEWVRGGPSRRGRPLFRDAPCTGKESLRFGTGSLESLTFLLFLFLFYVCVLKFIEWFDCSFFGLLIFRQQFSFHDNTLFVYTVFLVRFFFSFLFFDLFLLNV